MRSWLLMLLMVCLPSLSLGQEADSVATVSVIDSVQIDSIVTATQRVLTDSLLPGALKKKEFIPSARKALLFSIIPGGGQIYNRKYWKLPIVYGGFFGCIYALNWNNRMYQDYQQAYLDIMDDDPDTHSYLDMLPLNYDITGKEERFKTIFKRKKDYYRRYRDMSIFIMIGVWALATIDAYVDAELSTFDITKDLTLRVQPAVFGTDHALLRGRNLNGGLQLNLTF